MSIVKIETFGEKVADVVVSLSTNPNVPSLLGIDVLDALGVRIDVPAGDLIDTAGSESRISSTRTKTAVLGSFHSKGRMIQTDEFVPLSELDPPHHGGAGGRGLTATDTDQAYLEKVGLAMEDLPDLGDIYAQCHADWKQEVAAKQVIEA
jgi:hypothetical protein